MSRYPNAASVLADARQRLKKLGSQYGIVIVEGSDESRLLSPRCARRDIVIPAGGKDLALGALDLLRPTEDERILFVVDCDYDVPSGQLVLGATNLVVTDHPAHETDLFAVDSVIDRLVIELVKDTDLDPAEVRDLIRDRSTAMAEAIGRIRHAARMLNCRVTINVDAERIRSSGNDLVDADLILEEALERSRLSVTEAQFRGAVAAAPRGLLVCHGHDLVEAIQDVLRRDLGVSKIRAKNVPTVMRMACDTATLDVLTIVRRIRAWQDLTGRTILT